MGFKVDYREHNEDTLEVYLSSIVTDSEETEREMLKNAGEELKEFMIQSLNRHRRVLAIRYRGRPAMADDVKLTVRVSKWGEKYARVMGGKKTGTLWHLVNDGNLHSTPTHFMDSALAKLEGEIDKIWDKTMR